jgi:hypothetical protein
MDNLSLYCACQNIYVVICNVFLLPSVFPSVIHLPDNDILSLFENYYWLMKLAGRRNVTITAPVYDEKFRRLAIQLQS